MKKLIILFITALLIVSCSSPELSEPVNSNQISTTGDNKPEIGIPTGQVAENHGTISGKVTLENLTGDLSGTSIYLEGVSHSAVSTTDGTFLIDNIQPGLYTVVYYRDNYLVERVSAIKVVEGQKTALNETILKLTPLEILNITPADGSQFASISPAIKLIFNKYVSTESLKKATVTIKGGGETHNLTIDSSINFIIKEVTLHKYGVKLKYSTNYSITITGITGVDGSKMAAPRVVAFKTHSGPPKIVSVTPAADSIDVALDSKVVIKFDRDMAPETVNKINLRINAGSNSNHASCHPIDVSYNALTREATLTPTIPLYSAKSYSVNVNSWALTDTNGVKIDDSLEYFSFHHYFTTTNEDITAKFGTWVELLSGDRYAASFITFNVTAGKKYLVAWDNKSEGSGKYNVDTKITLNYKGEYWSNITLAGGGYTTPGEFRATKSGKIQLNYEPVKWSEPELFALKVTELP